MPEIILQYQTQSSWTETVLADFSSFLIDHAAAEKKASSMAMSMIAHYPDKVPIIEAMTDLAVEELAHFKQVIRLIVDRGITLTPDTKDLYVVGLRALFRQGTEAFLLDRLLIAGVIEARGHERFGLIAEALPAGKDKRFYEAITYSESKHSALFVELALQYFSVEETTERLAEILAKEAEICKSLPLRAALH